MEKTDAVITSVRLSHKGVGGHSTSDRHITYRYKVDGKHYSGNREYFGLTIGRYRESTGGYRKGLHVTLYYDPDNPQNAVIDPTNLRAVSMGLLVMLIFGGFGLYGLWYLSRRR